MSVDNFKEMLSVAYKDVDSLEVDKLYPFYGAITSILEEENGVIRKFELNGNIVVTVNADDEKAAASSDIIRSRVFEPGIFFAEYKGKEDDKVLISCKTIVFGKQTETSIQ